MKVLDTDIHFSCVVLLHFVRNLLCKQLYWRNSDESGLSMCSFSLLEIQLARTIIYITVLYTCVTRGLTCMLRTARATHLY